MNRKILVGMCFGFLVSILIVGIGVVGFIYSLSPDDWSIPEINEIIGVEIPQNATNLVIDGRKGLSEGLGISFDAPPESAHRYAQQFCGGVLYPGYDPFAAVDIGEPFTYAHPITVSLFRYFSYSTETPQTTLGNRCMPLTDRGRVFHIVLDIEHPELAHIRAKTLYSCNECRALNTISIQPFPNLPIWFVGLVSDGDDYRMTDREICIGTAQDATDTFRLWGRMLRASDTPVSPSLTREASEVLASWSDFFGADMHFAIEDHLVITATVSDALRLVNRRGGQGQAVAVEDSGNEFFYCFDPGLGVGTYVMRLRLTTRADVTMTYNWMLFKD